MDMTQNLSELSSLLFVISSPHTVNLIIENHGLSRLADNFTFQLCCLPYSILGLTYESELRNAIGIHHFE